MTADLLEVLTIDAVVIVQWMTCDLQVGSKRHVQWTNARLEHRIHERREPGSGSSFPLLQTKALNLVLRRLWLDGCSSCPLATLVILAIVERSSSVLVPLHHHLQLLKRSVSRRNPSPEDVVLLLASLVGSVVRCASLDGVESERPQ